MSMISYGAFSIFKRFSAREKPFHEMPVEENEDVLGAWEGEFNEVQQFNAFKEGSTVQKVQCVQFLSISTCSMQRLTPSTEKQSHEINREDRNIF